MRRFTHSLSLSRRRTPKWFPDAYYGNEHSGGVRGHYYHVFNTVRICRTNNKSCEARRSADYWVVGPTIAPDSRYTTNFLQRQHPRRHQHHHQLNDLDGKAS